MPQITQPKPICPTCSTPMVLDGVVRCADDYDLWSYDCPKCGFRFNMVEARTASSAAVPDRRLVPRHRVTKTGTIEFGDGAIPCVVSNVSAAGAGLHLASHAEIPIDFVLVADGSPLACHLIWRNEKQMGVAFD